MSCNPSLRILSDDSAVLVRLTIDGEPFETVTVDLSGTATSGFPTVPSTR